METVDILIKNANELITLEGPNSPRIGEQMSDLTIIQNYEHDLILAYYILFQWLLAVQASTRYGQNYGYFLKINYQISSIEKK